MKEDIYLSLRDCLERATGRDVTMERGRWDPDAFNILVGLQYLNRKAARELVASSVRYGLFDVEILDHGMINYKPDTRRFFEDEERAVFQRAAFFLSYFRQSCDEVARTGLAAYQITPGFCTGLRTHSPRSEEQRDIDALYFGHVDEHRARILDALSERCKLVVLRPRDAITFQTRNSLAARARVVLSLGRAAPFGHIGPMRLIGMAHLPSFCLSEAPRLSQPELAPFAHFVEDTDDLPQRALDALADPAFRSSKEEAAAEALHELQPVAELKRCLDETL